MTFSLAPFHSRFFNFALLGVLLFSFNSCTLEEVDDRYGRFSDLEVFVSGTLSGNPRSGLRVTVYDTEEDARNEVNAVTFPEWTDGGGFAFFIDLDPGYRYWVRVDTDLIHNINRTPVLERGFNGIRMTIL
ncbi:MAG: hypothetical protein HKN52_04330 [Eudoraea sp.]|nr:hypothetical protein [Eudoraea sp.]